MNRNFNAASVSKLSFNRRRINSARTLAHKKGLRVQKCAFRSGWEIQLPNGTFHYEETELGMATYIENY